MVKKHVIGFLTEQQIKVLLLKNRGYSYRKIASKIGVSHQSIALTYKKTIENIKRAYDTIILYKLVSSPIKIIIKPNTKLVEIPKIIFEKADNEGIKVKADFTLIYKLIRYKTRNCINEKRVIKPIVIIIDREGSIEIYPYNDIAHINEYLKNLEHLTI